MEKLFEKVMRRSCWFLLRTSFFWASLAAPSFAQEDQTLVQWRLGIGYNFIDETLVPGTSITNRTRSEIDSERQPPELDEECFSANGITSVAGFTDLQNASRFFNLVEVMTNNNIPIDLFCGASKVRTEPFFEVLTSDGDWLILNNPADTFLRARINDWIEGTYDDEGLNSRRLDEETVRVTLNDKDIFGIIPHQGFFYATVYASDDSVQSHMVDGLSDLGYTAQVGTGIDDSLTVIVQLGRVEIEEFYSSLNTSFAYAFDLSRVQANISTLLAEVPLLRDYENRSLSDKYGSSWLQDSIRERFDMRIEE